MSSCGKINGLLVRLCGYVMTIDCTDQRTKRKNILIINLCVYFSSFDMDAFKREYSNKDTATEAIPYFWEHFNKEDFSIWLAEYMYDDELKMIFMACNLVSGMFQRIEKLRKTAFASVGIFGVNNNASISGIWIFRGQELAFDVGFKVSFLVWFVFCVFILFCIIFVVVPFLLQFINS